MARKDWIKMPMWIFTDEQLTPTEACVLALIIDRAKCREWQCAISQGEIAEQLNISKRTTIRALAVLEEKKLIGVKRTGKQSIYTVSERARIEQAERREKPKDEYGQRIKMLGSLARERAERSFTEEDIREIVEKV